MNFLQCIFCVCNQICGTHLEVRHPQQVTLLNNVSSTSFLAEISDQGFSTDEERSDEENSGEENIPKPFERMQQTRHKKNKSLLTVATGRTTRLGVSSLENFNNISAQEKKSACIESTKKVTLLNFFDFEK